MSARELAQKYERSQAQLLGISTLTSHASHQITWMITRRWAAPQTGENCPLPGTENQMPEIVWKLQSALHVAGIIWVIARGSTSLYIHRSKKCEGQNFVEIHLNELPAFCDQRSHAFGCPCEVLAVNTKERRREEESVVSFNRECKLV